MSTQHTTQPLSEDRYDVEEAALDVESLVAALDVEPVSASMDIEAFRGPVEIDMYPQAVETEPLAEVVEIGDADAPSWYQRNSGALPKSEAGMADTHRRNHLPRPENDDSDGLMDRIRSVLGR